MVGGFMELFVGAAIYLLNPWDAADLLSTVMKTIGGLKKTRFVGRWKTQFQARQVRPGIS